MGLFHAAVWIATLLGIFMIWRAGQRSVLPATKWLIGLMLIGWGGFNFFEGLINHHIFGIHHVREWGPNPVWDYGFLLSGLILVAFGWLLTQSEVSTPKKSKA